jgi:ribosomal-protein-alanine N-acetyltransferase
MSLPDHLETEFLGHSLRAERYGLDHVKTLIEMEKRCFPFPWSDGLLRQEALERDYAWNLVWWIDGELKGYTFNWTVLDEMHMLNFAVHPDLQGQGIGGFILDWLVDRAREDDYARISLEVREFNHAAIGLYRSRGFETVSRRMGYYTDNGENALIMALALDAGAASESEGGGAK